MESSKKMLRSLVTGLVLSLHTTTIVVAQSNVPQTPKTQYDIYEWSGVSTTDLNTDMQRKYFSIYDGMDSQLNCFTNEQIPTAPRSLSFCHKFNDNACCVPQLDDENNDFFGQLTNLGLSCRLRGDIREDPLAKFYCLNCDPDQPTYVRVGASLDGLLGQDDRKYAPQDGDRKYHTADFVGDDGKQIILVSLEWAKTEFGVDPLLAGRDNRLAKCGLLVSVPCAGDNGELDGRDRYTCGDDLLLPANSGYEIIKKDNNGMYLVNESLFQFLNFPSLGTPMIDDGFAFHLVTDDPCDAASTVPQLDPSKYINPHCPRTADQIRTVKIEELNNLMTYRDWVCSNLDQQFDSSDWDASITSNAGYCDGICEGYNMTACEGGNSAECKLYADLILNNATARCCCGYWNDEKVFNSASTFTPTLSVVLFAFVAWALY